MAVILDITGNSTLLHSMALSSQECPLLALSLRDQKPVSLIINKDQIPLWKVLPLTSILLLNSITREREKCSTGEMDACMDLLMKKGLLLLMICLKSALNLKNISLYSNCADENATHQNYNPRYSLVEKDLSVGLPDFNRFISKEQRKEVLGFSMTPDPYDHEILMKAHQKT